MQGFEALQAEIAMVTPIREIGRVVELARGVIRVSGLARLALGERVAILAPDRQIGGEVIRLFAGSALVLPEEDPEGVAIGTAAARLGPVSLAPDRAWLGRVIDPLGKALDGRPLLGGARRRGLVAPPPPPAQRRALGKRLSTGVAVMDTLLPLVEGQRLGLFAGSGVGKSTLLGKLARGVESDVTVIGLVGERGRELRDFTENTLGNEGMARSVVITATSDQSPLMRRRCALSAMAVAEYFRDQGLSVLLLLDSITRFAEAHREVALASGEEASLRGYPPSTAHAIMALAERAGPGAGLSGDITAIFSVLVAGSDMEEPIADILRGTIDGHIVLDRKIAERGRYPAVDLLRSVSRALPAAASEAENALIADARRSLGAYDRAEMMVQAGLYAAGSDPLVDRAIKLWPGLDGFLAEDAPRGGPSASFNRLKFLLDQPITPRRPPV